MTSNFYLDDTPAEVKNAKVGHSAPGHLVRS
jgi:hypothetical protein